MAQENGFHYNFPPIPTFLGTSDQRLDDSPAEKLKRLLFTKGIKYPLDAALSSSKRKILTVKLPFTDHLGIEMPL
jgi:hypothetical protein